ncbi:MAG: sulfite exporter TauE/SafE family protein [Chitinophagaceae bacterium]
MDNFFLLLLVGLMIGTVGTLIGAGGGFILVPLLILVHPEFSAEITAAISIAVVAGNAISGSIAYARAGRIDFRAGLVFAAFTIPGSILGVYATRFIPKMLFDIVFGFLLIILAVFLFINKKRPAAEEQIQEEQSRWKNHLLKDHVGNVYNYTYNQTLGILISTGVGFLSPLLGIGGGIIHVPALVRLLKFPIPIATATSHFILAIMASVSVVVNLVNGNYSSDYVVRLVLGLGIGVLFGAQIGAYLSHKLKGSVIIKALAICLALVGARIIFAHF